MLSIFKNRSTVRSGLIVDFPEVPHHKSGDTNRSKKVTFCATSTLHTYFYDTDQQCSSWYDKCDYKSFRNDTQNEILSVIAIAIKGSKQSSNDDDFCILGIEQYLRKEFYMNRRVAHEEAVFAEQAHQLENGFYCYEKLAEVSARYSTWSSVEALKNAGYTRPPDATRKLQKVSRSSRAA